MSDSTTGDSLADRYLALIDKIVDTTLKGKIRSKEQVYQMLVREVKGGTGEIFERCLDERITVTKSQLETKIKATRILRALQTIEKEWQRWLKENQVKGAIAEATEQILTASSSDRLMALLDATDPNQSSVLNLEQLQQLASALTKEIDSTDDASVARELRALSHGIATGIKSWQNVGEYIISWIYDQNRNPLGFGGIPEEQGPWMLWSKQVNSPLPEQLFATIARNQSIDELVQKVYGADLGALVELTIVLQYLQKGLVAWFDQQPYNVKGGKKLSISTFLTFAWIWNQLSAGFRNHQKLAEGCFQVMLQILRTFSQREDFPLYGGIFASFSGQYLENTLDYLDEPLRQVEGTQEKARILTLLGYSQRTLGQYKKAKEFHEEALEIARNAEDKACEIANYNHLSRTCVAQKQYSEAINYSQRGLIFARQAGDRLGEANALANLGYSEVFSARELERMEPEVYESAINYLEQGLELAETLGDLQSKALCFCSLGIAHVVLEQPQPALKYLADGWKAAQFSGDLYLQGLNLAYLAEAYYKVENIEAAVTYGCLGMYLLEQIGASDWRQPAGLVKILQGQLGENFEVALQRGRREIIAVIGVDGYDYIPQLLEKY